MPHLVQHVHMALNPTHDGLQVEVWLKKIKCGEYAEVFKTKYVDGMALSGLLRSARYRSILFQVWYLLCSDPTMKHCPFACARTG